jgi:hypothetical protein
MEEKEAKGEDPLRYILERLSQVISQLENVNVDDSSFVRSPIEVYASPEEGVRLTRAFVRIKHPELRAAIILLATKMADVKT